jgi:pimeloyl-ACP methyl ester carboxylesterase
MNHMKGIRAATLNALLLFMMFGQPSTKCLGAAGGWHDQHDQLVARLRALADKEGAFGPAYRPLYHAALGWYEQWGGNPQHSVDDWMMPPEQYAAGLADALEHGRNYLAESPGSLLPLSFSKQLPDGKVVKANYWLTLPSGFPQEGRAFPLVVNLHGSGWLGHKISYVAKPRKDTSMGRAFTVTPIDEGGPWKIDFLNAYLDELLKMLPIDQDHVYVEGHSLGAMATWEWALNNPERFAAISPHSGRGEPFRASRLKNVPSWVIHGANDDVVPVGFSDQMVTALQSCGASVRYSVLDGVAHNMPDDLDENQVVDWYLRQTRSHEPAPADPRDSLGLTSAGCSPWTIVSLPESHCWESEHPVVLSNRDASVAAVKALFGKAHALGQMVDSPIMEKLDQKTNVMTLLLATPRTLRTGAQPDASAIDRPAAQYVRFYYRGVTKEALAYLAKITPEVQSAGHHLSDEVWITPLTLWPETASYIAEYSVAIK